MQVTHTLEVTHTTLIGGRKLYTAVIRPNDTTRFYTGVDYSAGAAIAAAAYKLDAGIEG